jgi:hypothetical protein
MAYKHPGKRAEHRADRNDGDVTCLFLGWRKLSLPDLNHRILTIQRSAVRQHFDERQWRALDRMRKRAAEAACNEQIRPRP